MGRSNLLWCVCLLTACDPGAFDRRASNDDASLPDDDVEPSIDASMVHTELDASFDASTLDAAATDAGDAGAVCSIEPHALAVTRPLVELARLAKSPVLVNNVLGPTMRLGDSDHVWTFSTARLASGVVESAGTPLNHPYVAFDGMFQPWNQAVRPGTAWTLRTTGAASAPPPTVLPLRPTETGAVTLLPTSLLRLEGESQGRLFALGYDAGVPSQVWLSTLPDHAVKASRPTTPLFSTPPLFAHAARVDGDYVTLYACSPASAATTSRCVAGRVLSAKLDQASAYQVRVLNAQGKWDWGSDLKAGVPVLENVGPDLTISYNSYLRSFLAMYAEPAGTEVLLRTAQDPTGPWSDPLRIPLPAPMVLANTNIREHASLAQDCERRLIISYFAPATASGKTATSGDLVMSAIDLD